MNVPIETIRKCIREQRSDVQVSEDALSFIRSYAQDSIEKIVSRVVELQEERNELRKARGIPLRKRITVEVAKSALREGNA